jgi:hypothetical protein
MPEWCTGTPAGLETLFLLWETLNLMGYPTEQPGF